MSGSASAENLTSDTQSCDGGTMCLELALEGERLCKDGDCRAGVAFFQAAIRAGTDDLRTLSAIYSQLGNAYFYLGDYSKAVQYHKHDLTLARSMGDKLGEAKASGNLGNTLKVIGKFTEAIQCCKRHLDISKELGDRLSEGRALYNLGNVYHAQGKQMGRVGQSDPGHFSREVRECLMQAISFYEQNLHLMRSLGDKQACGRACGNLGNTCYLLGDFAKAIKYHTERLEIAQEFGDKAAERRANSNLGNSHIFLGQFENATEHYKCTLELAQELGDAAVEAQACYSLGNTYTLLRDYRRAEQYHSRHLAAARKLQDRVGEGRACWSLGNAHAALGNHEKALYYANEHYNISEELDDILGMATADLNICDLRKVLGLPMLPIKAPVSMEEDVPSLNFSDLSFSSLRVRRQSMEQLSLIQITPDGKKNEQKENKVEMVRTESEENPAESFFDLLSRYQSERMDDQRATLNSNKENQPKTKFITNKLQRSASSGNKHASGTSEAMLELITDLQSERIDSQRAELRPAAKADVEKVETSGSSLPGLRGQPTSSAKPEEDFLDMIARVQGSRIEDQRTVLPRSVPTSHSVKVEKKHSKNAKATIWEGHLYDVMMDAKIGSDIRPDVMMDEEQSDSNQHASNLMVNRQIEAQRDTGRIENQWSALSARANDKPPLQSAKVEEARAKNAKSTLPDEDFLNLLMKAQSGRMEDQRATIPLQENRLNSKNAISKK